MAGCFKDVDLSQYSEDIVTKANDVVRALNRVRYDKALLVLEVAKDLLQERAYISDVEHAV